MRVSGKAFYQLIKLRFSDTWDEVGKLTLLDPSPILNESVSTIYKRLDDDKQLGMVLTSLFSFYAGRVLEDGRGTNLYTGPADHRASTILKYYVNDAMCLMNKDTDTPDVRYHCYLELNSIGKSKDSHK